MWMNAEYFPMGIVMTMPSVGTLLGVTCAYAMMVSLEMERHVLVCNTVYVGEDCNYSIILHI